VSHTARISVIEYLTVANYTRTIKATLVNYDTHHNVPWIGKPIIYSTYDKLKHLYMQLYVIL